MPPDTALVIAGVPILQDAQGRYSLNTLHLASGALETKRPSDWLRRSTTKALIRELESQVAYLPLDVIHGGERSGTYAHELLAVSYAGWISPAFQLKVNQAFLDMKRGDTGQTLPVSPAQVALALAQAQVALEQRQALIEARQDAQDVKLQTILDRQPPAGKLRPGDWLRRYSKPHLSPDLMKSLNAHCRSLEKAEYWRPDSYDWMVPYHSPEVIAQAYEEVTRQLSFIHDPGVGYARQRRMNA